MRTRQKFLSILLTLCMVFVMVPMTVFAEESYGIRVNNVPITDANASDVLEDGTVSYDAKTNTLTLEDAEISGDFSGSAAIYATKADLTIMLEGNNKITSGNYGIIHTIGTLTFKGEGRLTVNSDGDAVRAAEIIVDGTTLNMQTTDGCGLYSSTDYDKDKGSVSILNGASVTGDCKGFVVYADGTKGISISGSAATADVEYDGNVIYASGVPFSVTNSKVTVNNRAQTTYPAIWATEISISDNSEVTATVSGETNAVYTPTTLTVENSSLTAESPDISVWSNEAMEIDNGTVKTTCTGDYGYVTNSLHSEDTLTIEGNSDVLAIGGIWGTNGVIVSPAEGNKIDVKVGIKENGEEGTKHFKSSPYGETTTLDSYDLLGGYTYVHIKNHIHVYDQQITDDRYKISGATCMEPAKYYKSCVCGAKGTETFTNGNALGHSWKDPVWNWSEDNESAGVTFICENDSTHTSQPEVSMEKQTTPATCTEAGETVYTASVTFEGETYTDTKTVIIPTLGHDLVDDKGYAATCTKDGLTDGKHCTRCDYKEEQEVIPAFGHGETETINAKEAACTAEGYTGDKVCKVCGEVVEAGQTIAKTAHAFKDGKCTVCGAADPDYIPATPDKPDSGSPQTGDSSNLALWFTLMGVGAAGLCGALLLQKRRGSKVK